MTKEKKVIMAMRENREKLINAGITNVQYSKYLRGIYCPSGESLYIIHKVTKVDALELLKFFIKNKKENK